MAFEVQAVMKAYRTALLADAAFSALCTKVYAHKAPQDTALPFVVMSPLSAPKVQLVGTKVSMARPLVQVVVYHGDETTEANAVTIANRIDVICGAMENTSVTDASGASYVVTSRVEEAVESLETDKNTQEEYFRRGGRYRAYVSAQ